MSAQQVDDLMDLAEAVGVVAPVREAQPLVDWAFADPDAPIADVVRLFVIGPVVDIDHGRCEGYGDGAGCRRIICACNTETPCEGTTEQACTHHQLLCDECRLDCEDCRIDARGDR